MTRPAPTLESLDREVSVLRELVLNIRYELGEPNERHGTPLHDKVSNLEDLYKRKRDDP